MYKCLAGRAGPQPNLKDPPHLDTAGRGGAGSGVGGEQRVVQGRTVSARRDGHSAQRLLRDPSKNKIKM